MNVCIHTLLHSEMCIHSSALPMCVITMYVYDDSTAGQPIACDLTLVILLGHNSFWCVIDRRRIKFAYFAAHVNM